MLFPGANIDARPYPTRSSYSPGASPAPTVVHSNQQMCAPHSSSLLFPLPPKGKKLICRLARKKRLSELPACRPISYSHSTRPEHLRSEHRSTPSDSQSSAVYAFPGVRRQTVGSYRCKAARDSHPLELWRRRLGRLQHLRLAFGGRVRELHV